MTYRTSAKTDHNPDHQRNCLIKRVILDVLLAHKIQPGDSIDVIRAEHEIKQKGINKSEFSEAMVQLLDHGLIEMQGNAFCLTQAGFRAFKQDEQGGHA